MKKNIMEICYLFTQILLKIHDKCPLTAYMMNNMIDNQSKISCHIFNLKKNSILNSRNECTLHEIIDDFTIKYVQSIEFGYNQLPKE